MTARPPLPALTVHQPFAWAIASGAKLVENREWAPPLGLVGRYLAIHAGKTLDAAAYAKLASAPRKALWVHEERLPPAEELVLGAVLAVARVAGAAKVEADPADFNRMRVLQVLGSVPPEHAHQLVQVPWASGPWCWLLEDVGRLATPVPCRGFQRLWTLPNPVADQVRQAWKATRSPTP